METWTVPIAPRLKNLGELKEGEVLIEMYPSMAVLPRRDSEEHIRVQVYPHAST
jgi:hypothetical protein